MKFRDLVQLAKKQEPRTVLTPYSKRPALSSCHSVISVINFNQVAMLPAHFLQMPSSLSLPTIPKILVFYGFIQLLQGSAERVT